MPAYAVGVFGEVAAELYRDLTLDDLGLHAPLPARQAYVTPDPATTIDHPEVVADALRLHRYRALFSGPAVERVPELGFLRPERDVELSPADAESRGITGGDAVIVSSNGTSVELRAHVNRSLLDGVVRVADEHASELHQSVEVVKS